MRALSGSLLGLDALVKITKFSPVFQNVLQAVEIRSVSLHELYENMSGMIRNL